MKQHLGQDKCVQSPASSRCGGGMRADQTAEDERDLSYLHCPFLDPADYQTAIAWLLPPLPPTSVLRLEAALLRRQREEQERLQQQLAAVLAEWTDLGFTDAERDVWLTSGLRPSESHIAVRCRDWDIPPSALQQTIHGRRVIDRFRSGESVSSIYALLQQASA